MIVQSRVDPDTYYTVTTKYVSVRRHGDRLTMQYMQIPEQAKRFKPEIQEELMAIFTEKHPLTECVYCGHKFYKENGRKYCGSECYEKAQSENAQKNGKKEHPCSWCGKLFVGYTNTKYCGAECKKEGRQSKKKEDTRPTWKNHLQEKLQQAEAQGMTYAELQKQKTLDLVGRVVI